MVLSGACSCGAYVTILGTFSMFYCWLQVCEKACRDENGFKCHLSSESHARKMVQVVVFVWNVNGL